MLDVKSKVATALTGSASLVAALGSATKIVSSYPNIPITAPVLSFSEVNQRTVYYEDNTPKGYESTIETHLFTDYGTKTTTIQTIVDAVMIGLRFNIDYSADVPEPDVKLRHRVARYRRTFTSADIS